ncbi:MAG: ABC transporter substrate-binding protein [Acidimicrobiia bacterium]
MVMLADGKGKSGISRRELLKRGGAGAALLIVPGLVQACGGGTGSTDTTTATTAGSTQSAPTTVSTSPSGGTIKIGFVSPRTGPAAAFGDPDPYVIDLARKALEGGLDVDGTRYTVEILDRDGQSNPQRAAEVAQQLINQDGVDLMLATSTPETTNPVADTCEAAGVPCVSTIAPWEAWYFGRGAKPGEPSPFKFTFHFCFGVAEFATVYASLWSQIDTNKMVAVLWPNDADGNAIREALGPMLSEAGFSVVDPGAFDNGLNDFSAQISEFKSAKCEILNSFALPPDFATFWRQAAQQGFKPKIPTIAKTGTFPSQVEALGDLGDKLSSALTWSPIFPYASSLTGVGSKELAEGYQKASGKQWNGNLGSSLALFDVAAAVLKGSRAPKDKTAVASAFKTLSVETPLGVIDWSKPGPVPGVVVTSLIGGQWLKGTTYPFDWTTCENAMDPKMPVQAKLQPYA